MFTELRNTITVEKSAYKKSSKIDIGKREGREGGGREEKGNAPS